MKKEIRILMLEDAATDAELIERELRKGGLLFNARRVETRTAFMRELYAFAPDIILSDYSLPGFDALEALAILKDSRVDVPFILITGSLTEEVAVECMKQGVDDYILKASLKRVSPAVVNALEKKETERAKRQAFEALCESQRFIQRVADSTPNVLYIYDLTEQRHVYSNRQLNLILGYTNERVQQMGGALEALLLHPDDYERARQRGRLFAGVQDGEIVENEFRMRHANGEWRWLYSRETVFSRASDGTPQQVLGTAQDVTERRRAEERINHLSYHDPLTDLPNRLLFQDRLLQAVALAQHGGQALAVILLDLDRFKTINDTLGQGIGDRLLKSLSTRLTAAVHEGDTVARFGSDEFALLLTHVSSPEEAAQTAEEIQRALRAPFTFDEHELFVTASVGISLYPHDGREAQTLLKNAGAALYRAKEQGGNNYHFYTRDMTARAVKRLELENNMRRGLERGQFAVHYQPQVEIESGQLVGVEALARWQHPELGLVSPGEFIPLAEDTGLILPLGEWVMRTACAQFREWQVGGLTGLHLSVNVSARQFQQTNLAGTVARVLRETELDPSFLELELTESAVMKDPERAIITLRELKEMGIRISIDDFGTGYSSLSYLKRFPIDVLKVDQSFVRDITTDPEDEAIVMAIITLAQSLNLKVIAEGVETEAQLGFLRLLRCHEMQGYLFSKPLPPPACAQLLQKGRYLSPGEPTWEWWRLGDYPNKVASRTPQLR